MIRTKNEIIQAINEKFIVLHRNYPHHSRALQDKKNAILTTLDQVEEQLLSQLQQLCEPFVPEDASTLLAGMTNKKLSTEGIHTEEDISTLLMYLLVSDDIEITDDELIYCRGLPRKTFTNFSNFLGEEAIHNTQENTHLLFKVWEEAVNELLAQIPSTFTAGNIYPVEEC